MQDNIPDALIAAFERQYGVDWNDPALRNERLAMRYGWTAAMEQANAEVQAAWIAGQDEVRSQRPAQCLHQIQEPTVSQQLTVAQKPLTDAQIEAVFDRLPDGPRGFMKQWGYLQFARELLALVAVDAPVAAQESIVAGALFDFCGYLTTLPKESAITASEVHEATPMADALKTWADKRDLHIADADVPRWRAALSAQAAPVAVGERTDLYPGVMRCAKCDFQLVRAVLSVQSGQIHAGDSKTEPCPNGCGPLWPVTYKEYAKQAMDSADAMADRAIAAEKEVETLRAALAATSGADAGNPVSKAPAPVVLPEPVLYVSSGQLEKHCNPEDESGRYIPARKTAAGRQLDGRTWDEFPPS